MIDDVVKLYNPANASALTKEQIDDLQKLDSAQIKQLAAAYPNGAMGGRAYLLIIDSRKPVEKQLPISSTFQNLWNLRERNAQRQWVAYRFRDGYKPAPVANVRRGNVPPRKTQVVDLSDTDLMNLPGFKTKDKEFPAQTVEVTTIKKEPVKSEPTQEEKPKAKRGRKPKSQTTK